MRKPVIGIGADISAQGSRNGRERTFAYASYVDALKRAGAVPVVIPPQPENLADLIESLDGILLSGGYDCDPEIYGEERHDSVETMDERRQENDLALAQIGRHRGIPTLGICLGCQVMNVASGGTLVQDISSQVPGAIRHETEYGERYEHEVTVRGGSRLAALIGGGTHRVNSRHHQSVSQPGRGLEVIAEAPDGVVEGVEDPSHPFYLGVQWHPEDLTDEATTALFRAFVAEARAYRQDRGKALRERDLAGAVAAE